MKKFLLVVVSLFLMFAMSCVAFANEADYNRALPKVWDMEKGKLGAKEALAALLPTYSDTLPISKRFHAAFYVGDLYFRLGDYDNAKNWLLKCLDNDEFYNVPLYIGKQNLYKHGLAAAVIFAAAAAQFGKPADIDLIESKIPQKDLSERVLVWYCWDSGADKKNVMRTLLRFYKALAYKNAGNLDAMREIIGMSSFKNGFIRIGNKVMPLEEAAEMLK